MSIDKDDRSKLMRPSLTTMVSNFLQGPFVSFARIGFGQVQETPGETLWPYRGNIRTFVKRFLAATCRNRLRQIGQRGKKQYRAFGVSVYVPRWSAVTESESLSSLFAWAWRTHAAARAQDFSITRNETTRLRPKTRRRDG